MTHRFSKADYEARKAEKAADKVRLGKVDKLAADVEDMKKPKAK